MVEPSWLPIRPGCTVEGAQFSEPMRVETVETEGDGRLVLAQIRRQPKRKRRK